ncbi:MAG TPA: hypothetical protein DCZ95_17795 [Verrucomicrobia bacterium]|nr:MAG: hypothetical protein A2X46_07475 [Lentisphaerae bacterium GWF2_57_35]HBA85940.1 hypothetical protein [Verrucomicrobiota bacterium]
MKKTGNLWAGFASLLMPVLVGWALWSFIPSHTPSAPAPEAVFEDAGWLPVEDNIAPPLQVADTSAAALKERLGIEITALQVAVGGSRINLRYRVLDSIRADQLVTNALYKAYILDSAGQRLSRPNAPIALALRDQSGQALRAGRTYSYFFPNPKQSIKPGDKVTLVIGDVQARDLVAR